MALKAADKEFRDPIHGFIRVSEDELRIIDDPIFQRLRRIKQLSFGYMVYHGAEHSRFGHVLGAMHTIERALRRIKRNSEALGTAVDLTEEDIRLARFATLLHDIGHLPFSHALESVLPEKHERYSATIAEERFATIIHHAGIDPKDVTKLILGQSPLKKPYLTSLISGQLDVDKFDYLLRDSHYSGVKYGVFDLDRLLDSLMVIDNELVVLDGGYYAAEQLIIARYHMFEQVYLHKTKRAFEGMAKNIASYLLGIGKLSYPSIKELQESATMAHFASYDDDWFMTSLENFADDKVRQIVGQIQFRKPFRIVVDSNTIRRKSKEKEDAQTGMGVVRVFESDVKYNLGDLGITENEIVFDEFGNIPYKLRPYTKLVEEKEKKDEPDIVYIYDKKIGSKEPIEDRSIIVGELARSKLRTRRIYVDRGRYDLLASFMKEKYPEYF